ncbi:MAG: ATP-dependent DNA helicase [Verrucomicrobiota bacterium]|nr:ATP-dependent DNA helicase [Verrucomicrobiota bacterium]
MPSDLADSPGDLIEKMNSFFGPDGGLSLAKGYEYRKEQQEMACLIAGALDASEDLIVEAGTGVGKTLAYLAAGVIHALNNDRKIVISTKTINLQEQIIDKDLPLLQELLEFGFNSVLLKGRRNYMCPRRLKMALSNSRDLFEMDELDQLEAIEDWAIDTHDGTLSDLDFDPSPKVWSQVCSESRICTPRICGKKSNCFYQIARQEALSADVLIVNHTLLFTLMDSLDDSIDSSEGFLFSNDFLIIDEAHELENVAANQFGIKVSQSGLVFDLNRLYDSTRKKGLLQVLRAHDSIDAVINFQKKIKEFFNLIETNCNFGTWGREFRVKCPGLVPSQILDDFGFVEQKIESLLDNTNNKSIRRELLELLSRLSTDKELISHFIDQTLQGHVFWVEKSVGRYENLTLRSAPVDVSSEFKERFFGLSNSCVLTSATLSIGENNETLGYVKNRIGADNVKTAKIGSPFNYQSQMKIYLAQDISDPRSDQYEDDLGNWIISFIKKSNGNAFILFTSYKLMNSVYGKISGILEENGFSLYIQGKNIPRSKLLSMFRKDNNGVLFGTDSFWTGVDVPGDSLSNVIVTRIPFAVPSHPLIESRLEQIEKIGGNPFLEYSVPEAILKLRQGVGRLIRSTTDKGFVVILDNRIIKKKYGKAFLRALPPAPVKVVKFDDLEAEI